MTDILKLLLEVTLFASAMILVVLSIKAVFGKRIGIRIISMLWMLVLVRLLLPITFESPVHLISTTQKTESEVSLEAGTVDKLHRYSDEFNQSLYNNSEAVYSESMDLTKQNESVCTGTESISYLTLFQQIWTFLKAIGVWAYAFTVWVIGSVILLVRHLVQMIQFGGRVRNCRQTDNADLNTLLMQNKAVLGLEKSIFIAEFSSVDMPVTLGIMKPKILIPKGYVSTIGRTQLSLMIMHELCHIRRNDIFKNYLWLFAKIIHWFNPLVLFAFKAYRDDIEIACDEMVLRHVSEESKFEYSQGLLEAIKLSRNEIKTPAALSFCKDKTKLRERVETMIKPRKKSKTAAITAVLMATVMVLACFTTACQPTPNKPVVISKDNSLVETVIKAKEQSDKPADAASSNAEADIQPVADRLNISDKHLTMEIKPNNQVTINVDADIMIPEYEKIPMASVKPENFSQEQFNAFIEYLTDGLPVYRKNMDWNAGTFTKEEIMTILTDIQGHLADKSLPSNIRNPWEYMVGKLKNDYEDAKSQADEVLYDGILTIPEMKKEKVMDNGVVYSQSRSETTLTSTDLKCYMDKSRAAWLRLNQTKEGNQTHMSFDNHDYGSAYNTFEPYEGVDATNISMSYKEARAMAEDFVRTIDGDDTSLVIHQSGIGYELESIANYTKETSPQAYTFNFARSYDDILVKHVGYLSGANENIDYNKKVSPESLFVIIDDGGIVDGYWSNRMQYVEDVAEDVPLKDFDTIMETFENYCRYKFTWTYRNDCLVDDATPPVTLNVKRVEMNFMVIPEKDNLENYITVPVWDFIADMTLDEEAMSQEGFLDEGQKNVSILTINAIDGTVIDREQGF